MKNSNYFPFQRNRYFYGKLLSVDDFELEQRYMNDKRRLVNRFLFGPGIVTGLYVVDVDEQTVSVEAGFALDTWGREVIVDKPVLKKLSLIDGYDHCVESNADVVYLCMEYDEEDTEPVHNISGTLVAGEKEGETSCARVREGYRLFLTDVEPDEQEKSSLSAEGFYRLSTRVWQDDEVKITQSVRRFMRTGTQAELCVHIENRGRSTIEVSYDVVLNGLSTAEGKSRLTVSFDEKTVERTGEYELRFPIKVTGVAGDKAELTVDPESVAYRISGAASDADFEGVMEAQLVDISEVDALEQAYYRMPMEKVAVQGYQSPIYLAKITLVSGMDTYVIESVENAPFRQFVSNTMLDAAKHGLRMDLGGGSERVTVVSEAAPAPGVAPVTEGTRIAHGMAEIVIKGGGQRGDKFFSQDITHGLGLGHVTVMLGLERKSGKVVYGSQEIFENKEDPGVDAELAASVNEEDGSFVIGARLLAGVKSGRVRVHWTAFRDAKDTADSKNEKRIFIKPNLLELTVRESYRLEAVCENMVEKSVSWSVREECGFIDETGLYTAPNVAGVYEVVARSVAFPDVKASIFVVVRES